MGYFPVYVDIEDKTCVMIGGGRIALRKIEKLLPFHPSVTVIAPKISDEIRAINGIRLIEREYRDDDIRGAFMVICATNDPLLHRHVFSLCQARGILVNAVDDKENCTFLFPALARYEDVTVGVCTSGKAPLYAKHLKEKIEKELRQDEEIISLLKQERIRGKENISSEDERKKNLEHILENYIKGN